MAKLSKQDTMFKKHMIWTCIIGAVIIPLISYLLLPALRVFISSDTVYSILGYFLNALNTVDLFVVYGILISSLVRFGLNNSITVILLGFLRYVIIYASNIILSSVFIPLIIEGYEVNVVLDMLVYGINIIVDILPFAGAIIMTVFLCSKYLDEKKNDITIRKIFDRKNPLLVITVWVTVLISATLLSEAAVGTATDLSSYISSGYQITNSLIIVLVKPYIEWLLKTVVGYLIMIIVAKWFEFQWNQSHTAQSEK